MWAQLINILIGIWVMATPAMFEMEKNAANAHYIIGPLIITFAIIACWEVNRNARVVNYFTGAALAAIPFLYSTEAGALINDLLSGLMVILFSTIRGRVKNRYGGGWRSLFRKSPPHLRS